MSIAGYSPIEKAQLFGIPPTNYSVGSTAAGDTQNALFSTILTEVAPPVKIEEVPSELPIPPDEGRKLDYFDPDMRRLMSSALRPDWWWNVVYGGTVGTGAARDEYGTIVSGYFDEVKEEFGCDENYVPYLSGLPEYDKDIVEQMKASFYEKVKNDTRAETLAGELGVLWPPERNTTSCSWVTRINMF